ncbi:MAG: ATP-dependent zinc metalloprotease FtsH [Chloroflexi bacterium]|nr:ATP-dependent zinc metalloprotease FtsH [Chloroflexota bacterium]MBV9894516.1 ATP-dependent zinc metalloprotease FtsH [Chloroflexota bacterium]
MQPRPWWISFLIVLVLNYLLVQVFLPERPNPRIDVPYTFFKQQVMADNVSEVTSQGDTIQGTFKNQITYPTDASQGQQQTSNLFQTVQPQFADPGLETLLEQHNVVINAHSLDQARPWWQTLLLSFAPTLLLIGLFFWISSRAASQLGGSGGPFGLGRSRAKRYDQNTEGAARITFADVAGIDEAKQELEEIVDFLRDPSKYTRLGGAVPKGVLLIGAPGTGKTLLARAVAGEANVPFFSMGASEFVEMIVGVGASRVRDLFKQAREAAPAIIFIDELDAIGRARGTGSFGGNDEREQTLNQILTEMDGFSSREGVIVLAATNRPDVLDQALLRPGRFDRRVTVNPPDKIGREAILKVHTRGVPLASDVDLKIVAASTPGLVGADLRNLVNEAALMAARRNEDKVHQSDFLDALEKLVLGPARNVVMSPAERERVAYHEGGHTILGLLVPGADPVNRVTIMPRGQALGVTYQRPEDDRHNYSEEYLRARIVGAMGGRAAEEVVYGGRTTGAENDIQQATDLARQMVTRWGMSEKLGPVTLAAREDPFLRNDPFGGSSKAYSEATAQVVDDEIERILQECYADGVRLLGEHRDALDRLAHALLEHETLDEQEILRVTQLPPAARTDESPRAAMPAAAFSETRPGG